MESPVNEKKKKKKPIGYVYQPKPWKSPKPKPNVDSYLWGEEDADDLQHYIDWHGRHPHMTTPRKAQVKNAETGELALEDFNEKKGEIYIDEFDPTLIYFGNGIRKPRTPEILNQPKLGANADLVSVSRLSAQLEDDQRSIAFSEYSDPWYSPSVSDSREHNHVDGWKTPQGTMSSPIYRCMENASPELKKFYSKLQERAERSGGKAIIEATPATFEEALENPENVRRLAAVAISEAAGSTLADKKEKVSPWDDNKKWTKYTSEGTALNAWNKVELEQRVAAAVEFINNSTKEANEDIEPELTPRTKLKLDIQKYLIKPRKPRKLPTLLEPEQLATDATQAGVSTRTTVGISQPAVGGIKRKAGRSMSSVLFPELHILKMQASASTSKAEAEADMTISQSTKSKTSRSMNLVPSSLLGDGKSSRASASFPPPSLNEDKKSRSFGRSILQLFSFSNKKKKKSSLGDEDKKNSQIFSDKDTSMPPSPVQYFDKRTGSNKKRKSSGQSTTLTDDLFVQELDDDDFYSNVEGAGNKQRGRTDMNYDEGGEEEGSKGKELDLNTKESSSEITSPPKKNMWTLRMPMNLYASVLPSMPLTAESLANPFRKIDKPLKTKDEILNQGNGGVGTITGVGGGLSGEEAKDEGNSKFDPHAGKKLTFEEKVILFREKLGGKENLDKMAQEWTKFAEKVRKDAKKQKNYFDFSLDLVDSSSNGEYLKVGAILAGGANPNLEVNDLNLFLFVAGKIVFLDVQMGFLNDGDALGSEQSDLQRVCEMLVKFGGNVNFRGPDGMNALHLASASGDTRFIKFLCDKCSCDTNYRSRDGLTSIMYAAKYGHALSMAPLVLAGGEINAIDSDLRTPLHYAAMTGQTRCAQFLIRIGANKGAKDKDGLTPGRLADESGFRACAQAIYAFSRPKIKAEPRLQYMIEGIREKTANKAASRPVTSMLSGALRAGFSAMSDAFSSFSSFISDKFSFLFG